MKTRLAWFTLVCAGSVWAASNRQDVAHCIQKAAQVFIEINSTAGGIPRDLLERAECVGIVPARNNGKGVVVCRSVNNAGWTAPSTVRVEGGEAGNTDIVFVVVNKAGMTRLMQDRFTVSGNAAGGSRSSEIYYYSRAAGSTPGAALTGSTLRPDNEDNHAMYGGAAGPKEILAGKVRPPLSARPLYVALNSHIRRHKGAGR